MRHPRSVRPFLVASLAAVLLGTAACVSSSYERRANVLEFLYPDGKSETPASVVRLKLPLNVGIAFVPEDTRYGAAIRPDEKQALLERVQAAFAGTEGIGRIEVVPESFMSPKGGFANVQRIRSALGVDQIALVSFDQTQFDDPNLASITYWTIVGAYVIPGNENETHTLVHASVFDIESQALLLNASGKSSVEGRSAAVDLDRNLREDRATGFGLAVDDMIANLDAALARFREQVKAGTVRGAGTPAVEVTSRAVEGEGGIGAGAIGPFGLLLGLLALLAASAGGRRA